MRNVSRLALVLFVLALAGCRQQSGSTPAADQAGELPATSAAELQPGDSAKRPIDTAAFKQGVLKLPVSIDVMKQGKVKILEYEARSDNPQVFNWVVIEFPRPVYLLDDVTKKAETCSRVKLRVGGTKPYAWRWVDLLP